jgi:hypothetical protein
VHGARVVRATSRLVVLDRFGRQIWWGEIAFLSARAINENFRRLVKKLNF